MDSGMYHTTANEVFTLASKIWSQPVGGERDRATPFVSSVASLFLRCRIRILLRDSGEACSASRRNGEDGPGAESLVCCLLHGGSHLERIRRLQPAGGLNSVVPNVSVSLTNHKTKASKTC